MLGFASKTMGSKPCAIKPQPNLDDQCILHATKEFQDLYAQYKELEETNDLSYPDLSKCMTEMKSKIEVPKTRCKNANVPRSSSRMQCK